MAKKIRKRKANYFDNGGYSPLISSAGAFLGSAASGGLSSPAGDTIQGLGKVASAIPGPWGVGISTGLNLVGGIFNGLFGSKINEQAVSNFRNQNSQQSNTIFKASNTNDLVSQGNFGLLDSIDQDEVGKDGWFSHKARDLTAELNRQRAMANNQIIANYRTAANNLDTQNDLNVLANYAAYGGPITMRYTGTMSPFGNTFSEGGKIHIKPENRGKFTRLKERTGKSATWFKEHGTPAQRKMATFALNARKWKHAFGGNLITNGAEWDNGITIIGNGGTHEENPMEGVQMGIDSEGIPNLVEEGEVIFNDYVFSDRMKVPNNIKDRLGLSKKDKNLTFAKAAKKLSKESEERPNDPISKNGLEHDLGILSYIQEDERLKKQMRDPKFRQQLMNQRATQGQQYASGGRLGKKYRGPGEYPNTLDILDNTKSYAYWGNQGRNRVTNPRIAEGWNSFTWNNQPLYDIESGRYNPLYTDIRFQNFVRQNYDQLSKDWWNESNAPDYYRAGNTSAPTIDQMLGNDITSTGLMYDKKYGEAHRFGQYALEQYMKSLNKAPQLDPTKSFAVSPSGIKPLDLPELPTEEESKRYPTWMRYTPIAAAGAGILTDALGWTNKPDYSNADAILDATANSGNYMPVSATPLGDYLTYNPFDRNYYINKLNAESGATRRAIVNQSAGNRATALAGLLAANYNAQGQLGDLARKAEEYNLDQRERVATFNRDTNKFNSEMGLQAAMANQSDLASLRNYRLKGTLAAAQMREDAKRLADANRSANLTNFAQGLGDIGSENVGWNQMNWVTEHGGFGPMQDRPGRDYRIGKNGGRLLTKRK